MREAERSGRFVDLAVHSFNTALPPSRLIVPEGVSVDFVRRQIQYRVEVLSRSPNSLCMSHIVQVFGTFLDVGGWSQARSQLPHAAKHCDAKLSPLLLLTLLLSLGCAP